MIPNLKHFNAIPQLNDTVGQLEGRSSPTHCKNSDKYVDHQPKINVPQLPIRAYQRPDVAESETIAISICEDLAVRFEERYNIVNVVVYFVLVCAGYKAVYIWVEVIVWVIEFK